MSVATINICPLLYVALLSNFSHEIITPEGPTHSTFFIELNF